MSGQGATYYPMFGGRDAGADEQEDTDMTAGVPLLKHEKFKVLKKFTMGGIMKFCVNIYTNRLRSSTFSRGIEMVLAAAGMKPL